MVPRPRTLDVVDPLYIPYGALDVRKMEQATPSLRATPQEGNREQ